MLEVTVKTLDGKNRSYSVPDEITVQEFKEKIASSIEIPADSQRLIFQGRVLKNEKKLNEYDVNSKVIHVVQKAPPGVRSGASGAEGSSTSRGRSNDHTYMQGSYSLEANLRDAGPVHNVVQQVLSGMGDVGRNARVSTRSSHDGSAMEVHINLGHIASPQLQSGSQLRITHAHRMIEKANATLQRLENPTSGSGSGSGTGTPAEQESEMEATSEDASSDPQEGATTGEAPRTESATQTPPGQPQGPVHPAPSALAELLQELQTLNSRIEPHMKRYQELCEQDTNYEGNNEGRRNAQRLQNLVSEALHYISHVNHAVSDLMIDMRSVPPRQVRAPPTAILHQAPSTLIQQHVISGGSLDHRRNGNAAAHGTRPESTRTTQSSTTTSTTSTSNTSQAGPSATLPGFEPIPGLQLPPGVHIGAMQGGSLNADLPPGLSNIASSNPYVFMEVGPDAMTLNSISAHVVATTTPQSTSTSSTGTTTSNTSATSNASSTTNTNATDGSPRVAVHHIPIAIPMPAGNGFQGLPLPQHVMANLLQSLGGMAPPVPTSTNASSNSGSGSVNTSANHTSTSSRATTSTSASTTTRTSTGTQSAGSSSQTSSQPGPPRGAAFLVPGMPSGLMGLPSYHFGMDPFLPCQSRHITGAQRQQRRNQTVNQTQDLGSVVSDMVQGLLNQYNPHPNDQDGVERDASSSQPRRSSGSSASRSSNSNTTSSQTSTGQNQEEPPFMSAFRNLLQQASQPSSQQASSATRESGAGQPQPEISDDTFAQLVHGISGFVAQSAMGQQPSQTIDSFLSTLGPSFRLPQGEGLMTDIFSCISRTLTFAHIMSIFYGQPEHLARLRTPLQNILRTQVLRNQPMTDANLDRGVRQVLQDMQPEINSVCADARGRDTIDCKATLNKFIEHHLKILIRLIMRSSETDTAFGANLYASCKKAVQQLVALGKHCLHGGDAALGEIVEARVRTASRDVNPVIQNWMIGVSRREMENLQATVSIPLSDIEQFVVRHTAMETSPSDASSDNSFMSAEEAPLAAKSAPVGSEAGQNAEAMDVESAAAVNAVPIEVDFSPGGTGMPAEVLAALPKPPTVDAIDELPANAKPESWQAQVPAEWVPIIARDANRQRRLPSPQKPFSDGYINGMPAKRRKILAQQKSALSSELSNLQEVMPEAIKRAARAVGAEPITSHEEIVQDAGSNAALSASYEQHICDNAQLKLEKDPDFIPQKYPKSSSFFQDKKK